MLVEIPDAGHYPHETAPDQLLAAMEAFLASTTPFQYSEAGWTDPDKFPMAVITNKSLTMRSPQQRGQRYMARLFDNVRRAISIRPH